MKKIIFSRIVCFTFLFIATSAQSIAKSKPWTFLVYLAGANDLDAFIGQNLDQMMAVGSNDRINILVYLSTHYEGKNKETKQLYVKKGSLQQCGPTVVRDSGSVETLKEALAWACTDFPADHVAVVCWDHGSGPLNRAPIPSYNRGICYDFDTGHYLTDRDLLSGFSWARDKFRHGKKFDIIACDACLMASGEVAATLASCADYFVASEENIPGPGYNYKYVLSQFNTRMLDPLAFAKQMVTAYGEAYAGIDDFTLSAVDLKALDGFVANLSTLSQLLTKHLQGKNRTVAKNVIKKSASELSCSCFGGVYIDLLQFYKNLCKHILDLKLSIAEMSEFQALLVDGMNLFPKFIKANVTGRDFKQAGGLTIYFDPRGIDASYYKLFWTEKNGWWLNFLKAYLAA